MTEKQHSLPGKRTNHVHLWLDDEEKQLLDKLAGIWHTNRNAAIRRALLEIAAKECGV